MVATPVLYEDYASVRLAKDLLFRQLIAEFGIEDCEIFVFLRRPRPMDVVYAVPASPKDARSRKTRRGQHTWTT